MMEESEFTGARRRRAQWSLAMLVVVNVMSQLDRQIMSVLVEPIRKDLQLSDTEIGVLVGIAFAFFYTLAGLPIARIADRGNRRNLIAVALTLWSLMTAACGLARSYVELFAARVGVGVGEAGCAPPAQSILSDTFPLSRRGRALATYQLGVPIGLLLGLSGGGYLADVLHWRTVFFVVGLPGIAVAIVTRFVLREPPRARGEDVEPVGVVLGYLWALRSMRHHILASSLHTLTLAATATFNFPFLVRVHGFSSTEAGITIGLLTGVAGGLGTYLGGWLGDRHAPRDPRWRIWTLAIGALASVPFSLVGYLTEHVSLSVAALTFGVFGSYMYAGAGHAVAQSLVKPRMRAMTAAVMLFSMNLFGYGLGPALAGGISDALGGEGALRHALAAMNLVLLWAALHYGLAARSYRADLEAQHA
ncbi:MAG: MFS transporter [bacterium]|nr:MFS transporter [Deltaproteobacteria bacterium]MCP4907517.1 MFS transporter [bacterium]